MSETNGPASATPNQPAGALSFDDGLAVLASRHSAAPAATTERPDPGAAADETDQPETAPVEVEDADSTADDANEPAADEGEGGETDDVGDYIEMPDGEKIPVEEAVQAHKNWKALQARVTRKEQALAEERRALESERQKVNGELGGVLQRAQAETEQLAAMRADYAQRLEIVGKSMSAEDERFASTDWDKLADEDPVGFNREWAAYQRHEKRKATIEAEAARIRQEQAQATERAMREARGKFQAYAAEKFPDLFDPGKGQSLQAAMLRTAADAGYSEQDIANTLDPRALSLWYKASLYDQMIAEKSAATAKPTAPKPDASGAIRVVKVRAPRPNPIPAPAAALGRAKAAWNQKVQSGKATIEDAMALRRAEREAAR